MIDKARFELKTEVASGRKEETLARLDATPIESSIFPELEASRARARKRRALIRIAEGLVCLIALGALALLIAGLVWLVNVGRGHLAEWISTLPVEFRDPQPAIQIFRAVWF